MVRAPHHRLLALVWVRVRPKPGTLPGFGARASGSLSCREGLVEPVVRRSAGSLSCREGLGVRGSCRCQCGVRVGDLVWWVWGRVAERRRGGSVSFWWFDVGDPGDCWLVRLIRWWGSGCRGHVAVNCSRIVSRTVTGFTNPATGTRRFAPLVKRIVVLLSHLGTLLVFRGLLPCRTPQRARCEHRRWFLSSVTCRTDAPNRNGL